MLDPVLHTQAVFRETMEAMARPGQSRTIPLPATPDAMPPAFAALAMALCDFETRVWLAPKLRREPILAWFRLETGAPVVDDPGTADFAFVADPADLPPLDAFSIGAPSYPDRSSTLIVSIAGFQSDAPTQWMLHGPGIRGEAPFPVNGLPGRFFAERDALSQSLPCGIDIIFVSGDRLIGLPRSTKMRLRRSA